MSMTVGLCSAAVCAVLCACIASGHDLQSNQTASSNEHDDARLGELRSSDAGTDLDDSRMADLTNSIQSVFDVDATGLPSLASPAEPRRPPVAQAKESAKAAVKGVAKRSAKAARQVVRSGKTVEKIMAKQTAKVAKPVAQAARTVRAASARKPILKAVVNKELGPAGPVGQLPQRAKLPTKVKVGHGSVVPAMPTQVKEIKPKAIEKAGKLMPVASMALAATTVASNSTGHVGATKLAENSTVHKAESRSGPPPALRRADAARSVRSSHVGPMELPTVARPSLNRSHVADEKVGLINGSSVARATNRSQVPENRTKTIEEKAIEEAVVSLPMATFALEDPKPAKNKTEHPFPGNATQKAAFEKKAKDLEKEVAVLKARLANVSASTESRKHPALPAAIGTFSSHVADATVRRSKKALADKTSEPMEQIADKEKRKAKWPSMASVAVPVRVNHVQAVADPPHRAAAPVQPGPEKKAVMGATFLATPVRKVQSSITPSSNVDHVAAISNNAPQEQVSFFLHPLRWISSLFAWMTGKHSAPSVSRNTIVSRVTVPKLSSSAWRTSSPDWRIQDSERIAQETIAEHQHVFDVTDAWSQMEQEDVAQEKRVQRDDFAERQRADVVETIPHLTKPELRRLHGPHMSGFWSSLEAQDDVIEESSHSDDLIKYAQLTQAEDSVVAEESGALDRARAAHAGHAKSGDARLAIHEPWLRRELRDKAAEQKIHDSPELQMLQLGHRHRRK